ncbi:hypothetical protein GRI58_05165 [Porphyrobacter algicida]|uniref:Uncharacterized protein n=1 Tax=Qipengyuania algicida TaxID=1836209 RepID=A0A845AFK9_9SPHN|nr:hypothetical protein [Qipengyuania algicida]MXP28209.1 hypothetical protein [Qipengyuania algicida]
MRRNASARAASDSMGHKAAKPNANAWLNRNFSNPMGRFRGGLCLRHFQPNRKEIELSAAVVCRRLPWFHQNIRLARNIGESWNYLARLTYLKAETCREAKGLRHL